MGFTIYLKWHAGLKRKKKKKKEGAEFHYFTETLNCVGEKILKFEYKLFTVSIHIKHN